MISNKQSLHGNRVLAASQQSLFWRTRLSERPELRATAKVVGILEPSRRRGALVGVLKEEPGGNGPLFLVPCDPRMPRAVVRASELPPQLRAALKVQAPDGRSYLLCRGFFPPLPGFFCASNCL